MQIREIAQGRSSPLPRGAAERWNEGFKAISTKAGRNPLRLSAIATPFYEGDGWLQTKQVPLKDRDIKVPVQVSGDGDTRGQY